MQRSTGFRPRIAFAATVLALIAAPITLGAEEVTNSVGMRLQLIEAGQFEMGEHDLGPGFYKDHTSFNTDNDERPVHPVVITRPFYLAATEVTVGQFRQFVEATGYVTTAEQAQRGAVGWDPTPPEDNPRQINSFRDGGDFDWKQPGFEQTDDHPVTCVSHADATAYCRWLSEKEGVEYRLPTEAEWEFAARAGTTTYFSFGDKYRGVIQQHANIGNVELERAFADRVRRQWLIDPDRDPPDQHIFTAPVASYRANPWQLHDMYGNVWEWCEDRYLDTAYSPYTRPGHQRVRQRAIDPLVTEQATNEGDWRAIRGGSWFNAPIQCRSGVRGYFEMNDAACYIGFRVARSAAEEIIAAARSEFEQSEAARATIEQILGENNIAERRDGRLTLSMRRQHLTDELFTALAGLNDRVDIHLHADNQLTGEHVAALIRAPKLTGLVLSGVGSAVTDRDFAVLAEHPQLELLEITGTPQLTDALCEHLQHHDKLELLKLEGDGITDAGLLQLPALERLNTLHINHTAAKGAVLERFQRSPLRSFACSHLTDEAASHLIHFPSLQELTLDDCPLTGASVEPISQLPWLTRLMLNRCDKIADADFACLGNLYELQSLSLSNTQAGDETARGLMPLNNLRDLSLGSDNLSDAGLRQICSIVSLHNLTLEKEATKITDAGLVDLWRLANLRSLVIEAPKVTGSGLTTLHELPRLERIGLGGASISDVALQQAARSESLERVFVGSWNDTGPNKLTNVGLSQLANAKNLTQLDLRQSQTKVTDEAVEQLRQDRPQLRLSIR